MSTRILVTGAAGFIGSHFVEHLLGSTDAEIVGVDNFSSNYDPQQKRRNVLGFADSPRVQLIEADFCETADVNRVFGGRPIDRIVHLGAWAGVRHSVNAPSVYYRNNVLGTVELLEAARQFPVQSFVLVSSSTVYGKHATIPFVEDTALDGPPASPYGVTKRAAELAGLNYLELHNVPVTCVRPFSVYGPRLRPDLALTIFANKIIAGLPITVYGDGSSIRDFTHVTDICAGLEAAMNSPAAIGECINLGHGKPISVAELIELVESASGCKARIEYTDAKAEDLSATFADLQKARSLLGYQPNVRANDGVPAFVDWYRNEVLRRTPAN